MSQTTPLVAGANSGRAVLVNHRALRSFKDGSVSYGVFRLETPQVEVPRPKLTTSADRVSARLAGLLQRGFEAGFRIQMSYLRYLPQRLSQSACLRDCTALFCYAWNEYRRRQPLSKLLLTSHHNKAIRSLQLAINGGQAYDIETLGAMTLLERASALFGICQPESALTQRKAISHILQKKRRPAGGDELDLTLSYENQWLLALPDIAEPRDRLRLEPGWLEVIDEFQHEPPATEDFACFSGEFSPIKEASAKMMTWVGGVEQIMGNPTTMKPINDQLVQDLSHHAQILEAVTLRILKKGLILGSILELPDSTFFAGRKYEFASLALAHRFAGLLAVRRGILRIVYDLVALYGPPSEALFSQFREVTMQQWMVFPYLSQIDSVSEYFFSPCLKPSLEGTSRFEMDYLVNLLSSANNHQKRVENTAKVRRNVSIG